MSMVCCVLCVHGVCVICPWCVVSVLCVHGVCVCVLSVGVV